jgi:hypothetical protein
MAGKIAQDGAGLSEDATNHAVSLSPTSWRRVLVSIQVQGPKWLVTPNRPENDGQTLRYSYISSHLGHV